MEGKSILFELMKGDLGLLSEAVEQIKFGIRGIQRMTGILRSEFIQTVHETWSLTPDAQIIHAAGKVRRGARGKGMAGRHANRARCIALGKGGSFPDQTIQIRGLNLTVAKGTNAVRAQLVGKQKENIGSFVRHF